MDIYIYSTTAALGIFTGVLFGFISGVKSNENYRKIEEIKNNNSSLEKLKNALLSFAIVSINKDDMEGLGTDYSKYKGDKYPPLSGSSVAHACFTYIFNREKFKNSIMYTVMMESKLDAIEKYLKKQFKTDDQTMEFFEKFCEKYKESSTD